MAKECPIEPPTPQRAPRRLLILRVTAQATLGLTLGGCILRDGVSSAMFPGGHSDRDLGDASGHGRQLPIPAGITDADPKDAPRAGLGTPSR